jgi:hypothetical protein
MERIYGEDLWRGFMERIYGDDLWIGFMERMMIPTMMIPTMMIPTVSYNLLFFQPYQRVSISFDDNSI